MDDCRTCESVNCDGCPLTDEYDNDGQPDEYTEWQDVFGGDDDPHDYDQFEGAYDEY